MTFDPRLQQLAERLRPGARLTAVEALTGGVSARLTRLTLTLADGGSERVVLREHGARDRAANPAIAETELRVLERLAADNIPAPRPLLVSSDLFAQPVLAVSHLEGAPDEAPRDLPALIHSAATLLVRVHAIKADDPGLPPLPRQTAEGALERNAPVLLHGDVWPGNLIWSSGRLSGLIDWEDAATGDPLADIATARLEFTLAYGSEAARLFAWAYAVQSGIDFAALPFWDLSAAARLQPRLAGFTADAARHDATQSALSAFAARAQDRRSARRYVFSDALPQ